MKIVFVEDARDHVETIDRWWRENRPSVPDLFQIELLAALGLLADAPLVGTRFRRKYRRLRLQRTRHHVYYEVDDEAEVVVVVAVWGMPKGRTPKL